MESTTLINLRMAFVQWYAWQSLSENFNELIAHKNSLLQPWLTYLYKLRHELDLELNLQHELSQFFHTWALCQETIQLLVNTLQHGILLNFSQQFLAIKQYYLTWMVSSTTLQQEINEIPAQPATMAVLTEFITILVLIFICAVLPNMNVRAVRWHTLCRLWQVKKGGTIRAERIVIHRLNENNKGGLRATR